MKRRQYRGFLGSGGAKVLFSATCTMGFVLQGQYPTRLSWWPQVSAQPAATWQLGGLFKHPGVSF